MRIFHICVGVSFQDVTTVLDFNSPAVLKFAAVHKSTEPSEAVCKLNLQLIRLWMVRK